MTAEEIFESVTNGGATDFAEVAAILDRHAPWCLIGGLAVNCYVEPVYTVDADIVVTSENLPLVRDDLAANGFCFDEFAHSLNASKPGSKLKIQFTQDKRYQDFIGRAERRETLCRERFGHGRIPNGVRRKKRRMNWTSCVSEKHSRNCAI
jgi:hypothetical protein